MLLAYRMGMNGIPGILILLWYGMNGVVRLGFFNVMETKRQEETDEVRKYYSGLPITSIAIILPLVCVTKPWIPCDFRFFALYDADCGYFVCGKF